MFSRDLNSPSPPSPPPHNPSSTSSHKPSPLSSASLSRQASLHQTRPTTSTKPPTTQSNISSPTNSQATSNSSSRSNSINQKRTPVLESPLSFIQNAPKVLPASGSTSALSSATAVGSFKHSVPLPTSHIHNIQQNPDAVSSSKGRKLLGPMGPISRSSTPSNDSDISFQSASSSFNPNPESYYPSTITTSLRNRLPLNQMKASLDQRSSPADTSDSQISISNLDNGPRSPGDDADGGSTDSSGRENDDLKFAASKNENLVLELSIDGLIRHLSSNWEDIVGTSVNELINKPASTIVVGDENDKDVFLRATEVMKSDESSYRVRFVTQKAKHLCSHLTSRSISSQNLSTLEHQDIQAHLSFSPAHGVSDIGRSSIHSSYSDLRLSALHSPVPERSYSVASSSPIPTSNPESYDMSSPEHSPTFSGADWQRMNISTLSERAKSPLIGDIDDLLEMEGQGVLIYDHSTGNPSHTMWIIRPYIPPKPLSVDLSFKLVHILGFGVNILVSFLEELSEAVISDSDAVPTPPYELCRICERHVPTWWFERHSEICLVEHKTQSDLDSAHENLIDQRTTITHLLALLDKAQSNPDPPPSSTPVSSIPMTTSTSSSSISSISSRTSSHSTPKLEYRGISIPLSTQSPLSETSSPPRSPRITSQLGSASKRMLVKSFNLPKRSPVKLMELLIELCDLAVEINSPEIRVEHTATNVEGRIHSPQSESRIHCVLNWITPNVEDPALALLCEDTVKYARQKVDAALRLGNTITYFETIRHESEVMVSAAIEDTIEKATLQRQNDESIYQSIEEAEEEVEGDNEDGDDTDIDDNSSLFSESYLNSDALPTASASSSRHPPSLISRHNSTFGTEYADPRSGSVQTRSITPKSLLSDSIASSTPSIPNRPRSGDSTARLERAPTLEPPEALEFQLADLDLNSNLAYNRMQKKKSFSNLSTVSSSSFQGAPTAWTSIQRNRIHTAPSETAQSPSTPLSSPLIFPHDSGYPFDALNHRRQSSVASDIPRVPVSPLLTSTIFPPKPAPPSIKDYEIITAISKGAFGSVYLAKKKNTGDYFAIKVLKKADMIAKNQVMNVRAERAIMMSQSESPFVAKLFFTFQSKNYLYLVMEYLNGGDCAALVKVLGGLPEEWAQKYIAEVVLGVEDLHKKGIVHRDLKPDNLLINQDGHLKLTDFGLSRMGLVGRHTHQQSVVEGSSGFDSGSSGNIMQPKPLAKSITNPEVTRPSSTSSTGSVSGFTNPLLDSAISLVPEYFNLHSKVKDRRPTLSRSESNNSSTGEALFNASILLESSKLIRADEESISSNSSDNGGSLGSTGVSATPNNVVTKTIPLFDPGDTTRKFVGTPDYLAPETIRGVGQDEMSDWWSTGCILFEFLYGYPPFHAETPELVFENILQHNIQWPSLDESDLSDSIEIPQISDDARDLIEKLLCSNQEERIGAKGGAEEIRAHPFFHGINWDTLWDEEASFIPLVEDPESTDYFDSRGAESQAFPDDALPQDEDESGHKSETSYSDDGSQSGRSSRAGSTESAGMLSGLAGRKDTRAKLPLHIPPHVRDSRNRRLSEPVANDDFGSFAFKNLPMLDKANKDTLSRIKSKDWEHRNSVASESGKRSRGLSISTVFKRPDSPSMAIARHTSPVRGSANTQGSHSAQSSISLSPIITATSSVSSGPPSSASSISSPHRKVYPTKKRPSMSLTTMSTSPLSIDSKQSKFPGSNFLASSPNQSPNTAGLSSELYLPPPANVKAQTPGSPHGLGFRRLSNMESSPELGEQFRKQATSQRYPKVFDPSPSNSDTEEARGSALMRIQRRRELSRKGSQLLFTPTYRPLVVLICESNPVWRYSMETLLKGLNCRIISVNDAADAIRYATGDVKFDIIFTELRFANTSGADIARIIHSTSSSNTETPVVCVTNYGYEAANAGRSNFSSIITKPPTRDKLCEALERHCFWKPKETTVAPHSEPKPATPAYAEVGTESSSVITSSSSSLNSHKGMMKKKND